MNKFELERRARDPGLKGLFYVLILEVWDFGNRWSRRKL